MMRSFHKLLCSCFGIGFIKGGGTIAAIVCSAIWYLVFKSTFPIYSAIIVTVLVTVMGIWSANEVEKDWGKDSSKVVIDEVSGMCVSLLMVPVQLKYVIVALVLFRFFDIAKPLYIRNLEKLPKGWGVMADDVLAGVYSNLILQIIVIGKIF